MQSAWNLCMHGRMRTSSFCSKSLMQIVQQLNCCEFALYASKLIRPKPILSASAALLRISLLLLYPPDREMFTSRTRRFLRKSSACCRRNSLRCPVKAGKITSSAWVKRSGVKVLQSRAGYISSVAGSRWRDTAGQFKRRRGADLLTSEFKVMKELSTWEGSLMEYYYWYLISLASSLRWSLMSPVKPQPLLESLKFILPFFASQNRRC